MPFPDQQISDALTFYDSTYLQINGGAAISIALAETIAFGEIVDSPVGVIYDISGDQLILGESNVLDYGLIPEDSLSVSDGIVYDLWLLESLGDQLTYSDANAWNAPIPPDSFSDFFNIVDSYVLTISAFFQPFSDAISLSDATILTLDLPQNLADSFSLSDALSTNVQSSIISQTIIDQIIFSDASIATVYSPYVDILVFSDAISISFYPVYSDSFSLSDDIVLQLYDPQLTVSVGDIFNLTDSQNIGSLKSSLTDYIRRYLNDVER